MMHIMSMTLLLVCRHSCLNNPRLFKLLDDELDNFTEHDEKMMYGELLYYTDHDGLIHWYSNERYFQERVYYEDVPHRR
jgi:hypothetical protein